MQIITLPDVRETLEARELDLADPANITAFDAQARVLTITLTGKKKPIKQDVERVKGFMTTMWGQKLQDDAAAHAPQSDGVSDFDGSLDDLRTESDEAQAALGDAESDEADEAEASDEASEEGDEDEALAGERSVVKSKYRQGYKQRGNARGNNDWMHRMLEGLTLGPKRKLNFEAFAAIAKVNDCEVELAKFSTADKQLSNGWQGRARMSTGICLRIKVARNNALAVPRAIWEAGLTRLEATNKRCTESGNMARFVEWTVDDEEERDEVVFLRPAGEDKGWFEATIEKHEGNKKALAEGRKKAKAGRLDD